MTKSKLSQLLELVKQGETIVITDRNKPVATLQAVASASVAGMEALYASGLVCPPQKELDVEKFLAAERPTLASHRSLVAAILEEREDGR